VRENKNVRATGLTAFQRFPFVKSFLRDRRKYRFLGLRNSFGTQIVSFWSSTLVQCYLQVLKKGVFQFCN
jgi:hypothetical protein